MHKGFKAGIKGCSINLMIISDGVKKKSTNRETYQQHDRAEDSF